jgi:hypothetical protein
MSKTSIYENRISITLPGKGTIDVRGNGAFVTRIWKLIGMDLGDDISLAIGSGTVSLVIDEVLKLVDTDEDVDEEEQEEEERM